MTDILANACAKTQNPGYLNPSNSTGLKSVAGLSRLLYSFWDKLEEVQDYQFLRWN